MGFFEFLQNNIGHVFPIIMAAVIAVAIIAERLRALLVVYPMGDAKGFFDKVRELVFSGRLNEAVALCDRYPRKPVARVVKGALLRSHLPEGLIEHGIELEVGEANQNIQKRTSFLATIANVATLLGLFGTIIGLIHSFEAVGHADAQQKSTLLAQGISTAMNATMMGLGVAIPCMVAFSFLMNKATSLTSDLEHAGIKILDLLKQRFYMAEAPADVDSPSSADLASSGEKTANGHSDSQGKAVAMRRAA